MKKTTNISWVIKLWRSLGRTNNDEYRNEQEILSQNRQILAYLREGHSLTHRQAQQLCGCDALAARIYDIRHGNAWNCELADDEEIVTEMVKKNKKKFAKYYIVKK